jgi:ABC-2 type transport system permease protein
MLRLIGVELFKLKKRWMTYILLIVLFALSIIPIISNYSSYNSVLEEYPGIENLQIIETDDGGQRIAVINDELEYYSDLSDYHLSFMIPHAATLKESFSLPGSIEGIFNMIAGLGPLLVIILTASAIGSEYRWGTLRQMLIKGTGREGYLISKLLGIGIGIIIWILIALSAGFLTSLITTLMADGGSSWAFFNWDFIWYFCKAFCSLLLILAVYFALAALFSVLFRSVTSGMVLGIIFIYAESIIVALLTYSNNWLVNIVPYTIGHNVTQISNLFTIGGETEASLLKVVAILLAYCIIFLGAGFYAFRKQDITA